jgi:DNA-binding HxlR family transcriptional regulator
LVLRVMIFSGARHFRELLASREGISSNILTDRLNMLVEQGLLTRSEDPSHKQKVIYSLTEPAIELTPVLVHMGAWGTRNLSPDSESAARSKALVAGGPAMWEMYMDELREAHLGPGTRLRPAPEGPTVAEQLEAAVAAAREQSATA